MSKVKALHVAQNLEELNSKVGNDQKIKQATPRVLCRLADKLFLKAKDEELNGDEEQAYILYMRFIDIYRNICSSKECKKDRKEVEKLIPKGKVTKVLDSAELLSKSLKDRYSKLSAPDEDGCQGDQLVPTGPHPHDPTHLNGSSSQPMTSSLWGLGQEDGHTSSTTPLPSIDPKELYHLLTQQPDSVLVLDCRPRAEFNSSHPDTKKRFPRWLCVPEETVRNSVTDKSVLPFLTATGRVHWKGRGSFKTVVLTDDHSTTALLSQHSEGGGEGSFLLMLKDSLFKDTTCPLTSQPLVLEGGYAMWYLTYAVTCVGVYRPKQTHHPTPPPSSSQGSESGPPNPEKEEEGMMEYPSFPEISESFQEVDMTNDDDGSDSGDSDDEVMDNAVPLPQQQNFLPPFQSQATHTMPQATPFPVNPHYTTNYAEPNYAEPMTVPYMGMAGPLPPLPSTIPVALSLEGELASTNLSSENDLLSDYPQILMNYDDDPLPENVHISATTFTQQDHVVPDTAHFQYSHPQSQNSWGGPTPQYSGGQTPGNVYYSGGQLSGFLPPQSAEGAIRSGQSSDNLPTHLPPLQQQQYPPQQQQYLPQQPPQQQQYPQQPPHQQQQYPQQHSMQAPGGNVPTRQGPPTTSYSEGSSHLQGPPTTSYSEGASHLQGPPTTSYPGGAPHLQEVPPQQRPPTTTTGIVTMTTESGPVSDTNIISSDPRVAVGPIPDPPSYQGSLSLPSLPPVQPPIPPPTSIPQQQPTQQNPAEGHVTQADQSVHSQAPSKELAEEQQKMKELRTKMESEFSRLVEARTQQEDMVRALAEEKTKQEQQQQEHRQKMEGEKKEFEEMKKKYEMEVESMVAEKERYRQLKETGQKKEGQGEEQPQRHREFRVRTGVPEGWEKRLDHKTGRYYYVDHSTQTTHWNPPRQLIQYQLEAAARQQQEEEEEEGRRRRMQVGGDVKRQQDGAIRRPQDAVIKGQEQEATRRQQHLQEEAARKHLQRGRQQPHAVPGHPVVAPTPGHVVPGHPGVAPTPSHVVPGHPGVAPTPRHVVPGHPVVAPAPGHPVAPRAPGHVVAHATPPSQTPQSQTPPTTQTPPTLSQPTPPSKPVIDRSVKPKIQPSVDRSKKPVEKRVLWTPAQIKQKESSLQGVFGRERLLLTGLRNLGNTCFMNSTLQCLCHTSPVMYYFTSMTFQKDINYSNPMGHQGAVAKEFAWLVKAMWSGSYKSVTPRDFKAMVDQYIPSMQGNAQQDAQEFLAFLMNELHEDLNRVSERVYIPEEAHPKGMGERERAVLSWENHLKRNNSVIVDNFQGMYRSTVVCGNCSTKSTTFEPFMYLSLPIPPGERAYTLQDCLRLFYRQESVPWSCSNCKRSGSASKKIEIWKLPKVLLIALSRFSYDGLWRQKRSNYIDYPVGKNLLDLTSFVVGDTCNVGYRLYAVSNHFGNQSGGHYTACCLNPYNQTYYNFDDHDVKEATSKQVKSGAGYLLFYTSMDHRPPQAKF